MEKITQENSKEKILKVAIKLFAEKGFDGTSIREICKEAEVNICMISYYWGGKKELYQGIIEDLVEKQTVFAKSFIDLNKSPLEYTQEKRVELLLMILEKFVDFFYSNITGDLVVLLIKQQQRADFKMDVPVFLYFRRLVAAIFQKDENDREIIYKTVFILSQINSPKILPAMSLRQLGQNEFNQEDIKIIKENVKFYVQALLKEAKIV